MSWRNGRAVEKNGDLMTIDRLTLLTLCDIAPSCMEKELVAENLFRDEG